MRANRPHFSSLPTLSELLANPETPGRRRASKPGHSWRNTHSNSHAVICSSRAGLRIVDYTSNLKITWFTPDKTCPSLCWYLQDQHQHESVEESGGLTLQAWTITHHLRKMEGLGVETDSLTTPLYMKGLAAFDDLWGSRRIGLGALRSHQIPNSVNFHSCSFPLLQLDLKLMTLEIDQLPSTIRSILDALALRILPFDCSQRRLPQLWVGRQFRSYTMQHPSAEPDPFPFFVGRIERLAS